MPGKPKDSNKPTIDKKVDEKPKSASRTQDGKTKGPKDKEIIRKG